MPACKKISFNVPEKDVLRIGKIETFLKSCLSTGIVQCVTRGKGEILEITRRGRKKQSIAHYEVSVVGGEEEAEKFISSLFERGFIPNGKIWQVLRLPDFY